MILQALTGYYERLLQAREPDLELEGYKRVDIPFLIVIDREGRFVGIDDTRSGEGRRKQARAFMVPKIFEGSRTSNVQANLLWDKASYVFGVGPKTKPDRLLEQHKAFKNTIQDYFPEVDSIESVSAVLNFLTTHIGEARKHQLWEEINSTDPNIAFRFQSDTELICNASEVREAIILRADFAKKDKEIWKRSAWKKK